MSLSLRLSGAHDCQWLQVSFPGVVPADYETLCFHVCQPWREKGEAAHHSSSYKHRKPQLWLNMLISVSQAVEELLAELDLDKKSIVVGPSRVRRSLSSSNQTAKFESSGCEVSWSLLLCLRCSWSEGCCATWSSRGTSRSPAGLSISRHPAWDIWPGRNTANLRLACMMNDCPALYVDDTLLFLQQAKVR